MKLQLFALAAAVALSGCATTPPGELSPAAKREAEQYALYANNAGEPIDGFHYTGRYDGWTPLTDSSFVLWTRPTKAYLIDLHQGCNDLQYAERIGIDDGSSWFSARFTKVRVASYGLISVPCMVKQVREVDVKAVRAAQKAAREAKRAAAAGS
jgi:hypothetical protein